MPVFGAFLVVLCWRSVLTKPVDSNQQRPNYPSSYLRHAHDQVKVGPKSVLLQPAWNPNFRQGQQQQNARNNPNLQNVERNQVGYPPAKPQLPSDYIQQLNKMKINANAFKMMESIPQQIDANLVNVEVSKQISPKSKHGKEVDMRGYQNLMKEIPQVTGIKELKVDGRFQNLPKYHFGSKLTSISDTLANASPDASISLQIGKQDQATEDADSKKQDPQVSDKLTNANNREPKYTVENLIARGGAIQDFDSNVKSSSMTENEVSKDGDGKENDGEQNNGADLVSPEIANEQNNILNENFDSLTKPAIVAALAPGTEDITQAAEQLSSKNINRSDQDIGKQNGNQTNTLHLLDKLQRVGSEIKQLVVDQVEGIEGAVDDSHLLDKLMETAEETVKSKNFSVSDDQVKLENIEKVLSKMVPPVDIAMKNAEEAAESMTENVHYPRSHRDSNNSSTYVRDATVDQSKENDVTDSRNSFKENDTKTAFSVFESFSADASKNNDENEKTVLSLDNLDHNSTLLEDDKFADTDKTNAGDAAIVKNSAENVSPEQMISTNEDYFIQNRLKSIDFNLKKDSVQLKQAENFVKAFKSPWKNHVADDAVDKDEGVTIKEKTSFLSDRQETEKAENRIELEEKHLAPPFADDRKQSEEIQIPNHGVIVVVEEIKSGDHSESRNFDLAPVFSALKQSRSSDVKKQALQHSRRANKVQFSNSMYSFNSVSYGAFLMFLFFLSTCFILTCLGGWSTIKNICLVFFHKTQGGRLLWTKNGYTFLPQTNHKSA